MKKMLIAGNWKMNTNVFESEKLVEYIIGGLKNKHLLSEILVCPPFTSIASVSKIINYNKISLGAQNCYYETKGAYTGEISISMLSHLRCSHIIIGHSERRAYFAETDDLLNKKLIAILNTDIKPILCIGETLQDRQSNKTFEVLNRQLSIGLDNAKENLENIIIAYEPVWAIGTGLAASIEQISEAHTYIRNKLHDCIGKVADNNLILYGGSVSQSNVSSILEIENVNGGLIGGASLKPEEFLNIIEQSETILKK